MYVPLKLRMKKGKGRSAIKKSSAETVLVMQAGGSLGAYECGVFKSLAKHNVWFDIVAGTSIGSVNATVIVDSLTNNLQNKKSEAKNYNSEGKHKMLIEAAEKLERYWLNSADNIMPQFLPFKIRSYISAASTFTFGHPVAFSPIWLYPGGPLLNNGLTSPYLYDTTKFKQALDKTVNFKNLRTDAKNNNNDDDDNGFFSPRLILACTDVQKAETLVFDSHKMDITAEHVCACIAYPFYGVKWAKIDERYLWDGSLLSSTPLRSVMTSSPLKEKEVIAIDLFPRHQEKIPRDFSETWHRARDILFLDKSHYDVEVSDNLKEIFPLLEEMHDIIIDNTDVTQDDKLKNRVEQLEKKYNNIIKRRGRIIKELIQIKRNEKSHHSIFEDWDFSLQTIKELIKSGEQDAELALEKRKISSNV